MMSFLQKLSGKAGPFRISLANPCNESWEDMTQKSCGKFCSTCQKTVMDFTDFSDEAFIHYFQTHATKGCGRFSEHQFSILIPARPNTASPLRNLHRYALTLIASLSFGIKGNAQQQNINPVETIQAHQTEKRDSIPGPLFLSGKVLDLNGEGIPGAAVMVAGTTVGVITDVDGIFSLKIEQNMNIVLKCHAIGMLSEEVVLNDTNNISIILKTNNDTAFDNISIGGYGSYESTDDPTANLWYYIKKFFKNAPEETKD